MVSALGATRTLNTLVMRVPSRARVPCGALALLADRGE